MTGTPPKETDRVGSVWWYSQIVKRRRLVVIAAMLGGAILGLAIGLLTPRQYLASSRFAASTSKTPQGALSAIGAQFGIAGLASGYQEPELYINVLRSRNLLRELGRIRYRTTNPHFEGTLYDYFEIPDTTSASNLQVVSALNSIIRTGIDRPTGIVSFEVSTKHPELSEAIATNGLRLLNEYDVRRRQEQAKLERQFVASRLEEKRAKLTADENALTEFFRRNRLPGVSQRAEEARLQRQVSLSQQVYLALAQNLAQAELEESRNTPTIVVLETPEGFVEKRPRGTLRLMVMLAVFGFAISFMAAVVSEYRSSLQSI